MGVFEQSLTGSGGAPNLQTAISLQELPALPTVSTRLLGMMGRQNVDLREVGNLIASDATISAEVLRIANSSMYSMRQEIKSILQALAFLGLERVKALACTVALRSYLGNVLQIPAMKRCWRHNLATAILADEMANWMQADGAEAYTAGILHDIGRFALIAISPANYLEVLDRCARTKGSIFEAERAIYNIDHCEAGAVLAASWGLPRTLQNAIGHHHSQLTSPPHSLSGIVHYACSAADQLGFSVLDHHYDGTTHPLEDFIAHLSPRNPANQRISLEETRLLVATRINSMES